jgi:glycosyltransferase involved in cell wall biosynthesis
MPSVDVIVPNYQYGHLLSSCIESALNQNVPDLRVLVIDNASTDDSLSVARSFAVRDHRIKVIEHPCNLGHTTSFNEGIDWATADYLMILCADDLLAPGALARALTIMEARPEVCFAYGKEVVCSDRVRDSSDCRPPEPVTWRVSDGREYIKQRCNMPLSYFAGFVLIRTAIQKRVGHFSSDLRFFDDLEMLLRLAHFGSVAETNAVQGLRREHALARSKVLWQGFEWRVRGTALAFESFFSGEGRAVEGARHLRRLVRGTLGAYAYWSAVSHCVRGQIAAGMRLFRIAFGLAPHMAVLPPVSHLRRMDAPLVRIKEVLLRGHRSAVHTQMRLS